jgi:response regulator RpfG family c-di-GMP phosphodiesterase
MMSEEREALREQLRGAREEMDRTCGAVEAFLGAMLEARSEDSKGHAARVAEITAFVADKFKVAPALRETLRTAAMLHEVGMLLIPDTVYHRQAPDRSALEVSVVTHQAARGSDFLRKCPGFEAVADVLRHLGEKVDGSGVPDGLKRRTIPLAARIVAGADRLDDLWRTGTPPLDTLLAALEAEAGVSLDPNVVNSLCQYAATRLYTQVRTVREVGIHQLEPGMVTGAALFTHTGTKLFAAGTVLTRESIDLLARYAREYPVEETVFIRVN